MLRPGEVLPADLAAFLTETGGTTIVTGAGRAPIEISGPDRLLRANPVIVGDEFPDDPSDTWYVIAWDGDQPYATIDLSPARLGRVHDAFHEAHAVAGSCPVIARSFTEFLDRLTTSTADGPYWEADDWEPLGDAYDPVEPPATPEPT